MTDPRERASSYGLSDDLLAALRERGEHLLPLGDLWGEPHRDDASRAALEALAGRLRDMYPYGDPRYIGQILKPPHPVAWAAHAMTALINPNNHALDGGPATAELEKEVVADLARMFGMPRHLGHLTSSGTLANLEALFVAREIDPQGTIVSSEAAHYTHKRMCALLGVAHETVAQDLLGRMDLGELERRLERGGVSTVVATLGTTSFGALDQVHRIVELARRFGARVHVDGAYGGFHVLLAGAAAAVDPAPFEALAEADSIVVDPHKHGLQAFGCGSVLFADPDVGRFYAHDSPYTYFTSDELHLGEISLECSRPGAPAAALWATIRAVGLDDGGLGAALRRGRRATLRIADALHDSEHVGLVLRPELDIVCYYPIAERASEITRASDAAFDHLAARGWHVAKLTVDAEWLRASGADIVLDGETVTVLRSCVMKPEHLDVADEFIAAVEEISSALAGKA